jgi:Rrf2 family protein
MKHGTRFYTAVHILTLLSDHHKPLSSTYMADSAGVNPVTIRKLTRVLSAAGLVKTKAGVVGGSLLGRPASDISLREVYLLLRDESPFGISPEDPSDSTIVGRNLDQVLTNLLDEAEQQMIDALAQITIFDILKRVQRGGGFGLNM